MSLLDLVVPPATRSKGVVGKISDLRKKLGVKFFEALTGTALGDWTGSGQDPELRGYTRLTGRTRDGKMLRDLDPLSQEQMVKVAHFLYDSHMLAGWLIDQRVDLLIGGEVTYTVAFDPEKVTGGDAKKARQLADDARTHLDQFWEHPSHNIRFRGREYLTSFMVTGELCLPIANENDVNGVPELDYIDPAMLSEVNPLEKSAMTPGSVKIRKPGTASAVEEKVLVRYNPETERLEGECFYWRNSRLLNAMRGRSELLRPADHLDSLDQYMFATIDRAMLLNAVVWDMQMDGATDADILKAVKNLKATLAKPGGVFGHNEKMKLGAVVPQLAASDSDTMARLLANHIRGSKSMPESWYAEGGNANRATAGEQTDVAYKSLEAWQVVVKDIFGTLLAYAYDNLQELQEGAFPKRSEGGVTLTVVLPAIAERDMSRAAAGAVQVEAMLQSAVEGEMLSKKTARKVFYGFVERLGTTVDPEEEETQIEEERADREAAAADRQATFARNALNMHLAAAGGDPPPADAPPPPQNGNGGSDQRTAEAIREATAQLAALARPQNGDVHVHLPEGMVTARTDVHVPPASVVVQPTAPTTDVHVQNLVLPAAVTPPAVTVENHVTVPPAPPAPVEITVPPAAATISEQTVERAEGGGPITKTTTVTRPLKE